MNKGLLSAALKKNRGIFLSFMPYIFLLLLVAVFATRSKNFFNLNNLYLIIQSASILLIISCANTFVILMGCIDLSVGTIATISGVIAVFFVPKIGIYSFLIGIVVGGICGFINANILVRWKIPSFLTTLGTSTIFLGLALAISGGAALIVWNEPFKWLANGTLIGDLPNLALWSLVVFLISIYLNTRTRFGLYMYAIGGAEKTSELLGVAVEKYKILAFTLSGLFSGLAGSLLAGRLGSGEPGMGIYLMLLSITAIVIGGTAITGGSGSVVRTFAGVLVITVLSNGMNILSLAPYTQTVIKGCVIILAVALIVNRKSDLVK
jgi:ribose/xylose/arabinose/galactoside ABC-type transport system permease subunit